MDDNFDAKRALINAYFEKQRNIHSGDIFDADAKPIDIDLAERVVGLELRPEKAAKIKTIQNLGDKFCTCAPGIIVPSKANEVIEPGKVGPHAMYALEIGRNLLDVGAGPVRDIIAEMIRCSDRFGISRIGRKEGFMMSFVVTDIWKTYRLMSNDEAAAYEEWYESIGEE